MAVPSMDPRTGGTCCNLISSKFFSVVMGWVQLIFWVVGFFALIFKPSSVSAVVKNADTTTMAIAGVQILISILFSVFLILGLHKNRKAYIKAWCVYCVVYMVLIVLSFVVNIFVQPQNLGFRGFFSLVICFLLHVMFFFVVRGYYLMTYCNNSNQLVSNQPKV
ncbi:uncharacterized protein LOC142977017 [Anticarsia gemmatalis]|uniref:uncharacterized protein LOC142977017 n=1 Tax=Anticarsia gemmatalis TaxID=129554 RepID=UPI003F761352